MNHDKIIAGRRRNVFSMAKNPKDRLRAEIELAVQMARPHGILEHAESFAARLASRHRAAGVTAPEIHAEIVRLAKTSSSNEG